MDYTFLPKYIRGLECTFLFYSTDQRLYKSSQVAHLCCIVYLFCPVTSITCGVDKVSVFLLLIHFTLNSRHVHVHHIFEVVGKRRALCGGEFSHHTPETNIMVFHQLSTNCPCHWWLIPLHLLRWQVSFLLNFLKKDPRRAIKFRPLSLFDSSINDLDFNPNCIFIHSICFATWST